MTEADRERADVFLSYAREDRAFAQSLARRLEVAGYAVWWDFDLIGGRDFRSEIRAAIGRADRVLVLWSEASVRSHFVIDEASLAKADGKLVPVCIDDAPPPLGFGALHTVTCRDPDEDAAAVLAALASQPAPAHEEPAPSRRRALRVGLAGLGAAALGLGGYGGWTRFTRFRQNSGAAARLPRLALVVGNSTYESLPSLANPVRDARAVSRRLAEAGFRVGLLQESTAADFRNAIRQFKTLLSLGGIGVFYYAGHAAHMDGRDYIVPVDAPQAADPQAVIRSSIEITEIRAPITTFFSALPLRVNHAGLTVVRPPPDHDTGSEKAPDWQPGNSPETDLQPEIPKEAGRHTEDLGVMTIYSASRGNVAFDGDDEHSPFARAFLTEIDKDDGDAAMLARAIRIRVTEMTNFAQTPWIEDDTRENFYFNAPTRDPRSGILRFVFLDSGRVNPFAVSPALLGR